VKDKVATHPETSFQGPRILSRQSCRPDARCGALGCSRETTSEIRWSRSTIGPLCSQRIAPSTPVDERNILGGARQEKMSEGCFAHAKVNSMRKEVYAFLYAVAATSGCFRLTGVSQG
jgi:hypothetical protein